MDDMELGFDWKKMGFDRAPDRYESSVRAGFELFGYDAPDGVTTWYTKDGEVDSFMPTELMDALDNDF